MSAMCNCVSSMCDLLDVSLAVNVVTLQCREIAVGSHNEMTKVATELHSVSNSSYFFCIKYIMFSTEICIN